MQGSTMTYREGLQAKITELRAINEKKRACQTKVREVSDELDALEQEKTAIVKILNNKDLNTADDVKSAIKKLNYKMNTTTMNNTDSNKTIKEIANLEANIEKAERLSEIKPKINELY